MFSSRIYGHGALEFRGFGDSMGRATIPAAARLSSQLDRMEAAVESWSSLSPQPTAAAAWASWHGNVPLALW